MRPLAVTMLLLAVVGVPVLGHPVSVAYVTSDSMEPTLQTHDVVLVQEAETPQVGDIVAFWSTQRGSYVTHRVVAVEDGGLITKGDANDVRDQETGEPPVAQSQVLGTVWEVGGHPVSVPALGWVLSVTHEHRFAAMAAALLVGLFTWTRTLDRRREPVRHGVAVRDIILPLLVGGLLVSVAVVGVSATTHDLTYVVTNGDSSAANTIPVGEPTTDTVELAINSLPGTSTVIRGDGVTVSQVTTGDDVATVTVTVPPSSETGAVHATVTVAPYPSTLPKSVLGALYDVHPLVAALGSVLPIFGPLSLLYFALFDGDARLRHRVRRLYRSRGGFL
ncbi:MAG: signal peptidase I [Halobacteriota archaeon]